LQFLAVRRQLRAAMDRARQTALENATQEELATVAFRNEQRRNQLIASQVSPGIASRRAAQATASKQEMLTRLDAVRRAQRRQPSPIGIPQEELPEFYRRQSDDDGAA